VLALPKLPLSMTRNCESPLFIEHLKVLNMLRRILAPCQKRSQCSPLFATFKTGSLPMGTAQGSPTKNARCSIFSTSSVSVGAELLIVKSNNFYDWFSWRKLAITFHNVWEQWIKGTGLKPRPHLKGAPDPKWNPFLTFFFKRKIHNFPLQKFLLVLQ